MASIMGIFILIAFLVSCSPPSPERNSSLLEPTISVSEFETIPGLLKRGNSNNEKLIIFVHGFSGNSRDTWLNESTSSYWPQMITQDPNLREFDVYIVKFPSSFLKNSGTLYESFHFC